MMKVLAPDIMRLKVGDGFRLNGKCVVDEDRESYSDIENN